MSRKDFFLLFLSPFLLFASEQDWSVNKTLSLEAEGLYMRRDQTHDKPLITKGKQTPLELWDMQDSIRALGSSPGLKITARLLAKRGAWEASYAFFKPWTSSRVKNSTGDLYFSPGQWKYFYDFSSADRAQVKCSFYFEDAQFNGIDYIPKRVARPFATYWLLGFRYLFVKENLNNIFTRGSDTSNYKVDARNEIYALQGGIGVVWNPSKVWGWDAFGKVGTGVDLAHQKTFFGDYNNQVILRDFKRKTISWPLIVDLSLRLNCNLTSLFNLFVGYQMIYLNGVALSVDQLVYTPQYEPSIKATGEVLISGVFGGINLNF